MLYKVTLPLIFQADSLEDCNYRITRMIVLAQADDENYEFPCERAAGNIVETPWKTYEDWIEDTSFPIEELNTDEG